MSSGRRIRLRSILPFVGAFTALCLFWSTGFASTEKPQAGAPSPALYNIPLNEIQAIIPTTTNSDAVLSTRTHPQLQLGSSTWLPANLKLPSYIPASSFDRVLFPETAILLVFPLTTEAHLGGHWYAKAGLQYQSMSRSGSLDAGGITSPLSDTLYWLGVKAGTSWYPDSLQTRRLMPYAGASLIPSLLLTQRSAFSDGLSIPALPLQLEIGADLSILSSVAALGSPLINIAITSTEGSVHDSNLHRFALAGGLRFPL